VNLEEYLADFTPEIKTLVKDLRNLAEVVSWGNLGYQTRKKRYVCTITPHKEHVNFRFWREKELEDPEGMLQGRGKKLMHVKMTSLRDIKSDALKALIKENFELEEI
jgi:hypothetical protein